MEMFKKIFFLKCMDETKEQRKKERKRERKKKKTERIIKGKRVDYRKRKDTSTRYI